MKSSRSFSKLRVCFKFCETINEALKKKQKPGIHCSRYPRQALHPFQPREKHKVLPICRKISKETRSPEKIQGNGETKPTKSANKKESGIMLKAEQGKEPKGDEGAVTRLKESKGRLGSWFRAISHWRSGHKSKRTSS